MITNIPLPLRNNNKLQGEFYPLQKQELIALRQAKLINNTAFVHLALRYENPFCALRSRSLLDRPVEINPKKFALSWNIPESSIYKAIGKLKKLGLILIKSGRLLIEWITKSDSNTVETSNNSNNQYKCINTEAELSDPATNYQIRQKILRSGNELSDPAKNSQIRQNQEPGCLPDKESGSLQTPQTVQSSHTLQIPDQEKIQETTNVNKETENDELNNEENDELNNTDILAKKTINDKSSSAQEKENSPAENNCRGERSISGHKSSEEPSSNITVTKPQPVVRPKSYTQQYYNPQAVVWNWLPDGPWLVEGKLDVNFQEWLAKKWMVKHGDDIYEAKANVLSYFRNDPAKLAIRWEQYQEEYIAKAGNFKTRLDHGCQITEEEKQQAISHRNAIKPLLPEQELTSGNSSGRIQNSEFRTLRESSVQAQNSAKQLPATSSSNENPSKTIETIEGEVIEQQQNSKDEFNSLLDEDFWEEVKEKDNQNRAEIEANYYQSSDAPTNNSINTQSKADTNSSRGAYSNTTIGQDLVLTDEFSGRTVRYKDYTGIAEQQEKEVSPEQRKKVLSMISDFVNGFKLKKAEAEAEASFEPPQELLGDLELLNQDLTCPVIRKDSITKNRVQKWLNAGYSCDYDLDGNPCFVYKS